MLTPFANPVAPTISFTFDSDHYFRVFSCFSCFGTSLLVHTCLTTIGSECREWQRKKIPTKAFFHFESAWSKRGFVTSCRWLRLSSCSFHGLCLLEGTHFGVGEPRKNPPFGGGGGGGGRLRSPAPALQGCRLATLSASLAQDDRQVREQRGFLELEHGERHHCMAVHCEVCVARFRASRRFEWSGWCGIQRVRNPRRFECLKKPPCG